MKLIITFKVHGVQMNACWRARFVVGPLSEKLMISLIT
jgi:hypothetical protein